MRAVIAEDSGIFREALTTLLTNRGISVVAQATDATELDALIDTSLADTGFADVVLLDIRMPPTHTDEGIRAAKRIRLLNPTIGLVVLSTYAEAQYAGDLLAVANPGAGYLAKDRVRDADRLVEAIRLVVAGEVVIDPKVVKRLLDRRRPVNPLDRLTPGEYQVLALVAEGRSNGAIGSELHLAPSTVEKRITAIAQKLGLPQTDDPGRGEVNVRVLAVLEYLRNTG